MGNKVGAIDFEDATKQVSFSLCSGLELLYPFKPGRTGFGGGLAGRMNSMPPMIVEPEREVPGISAERPGRCPS